MFSSTLNTQLQIFNFLPQAVQSAIVGYANAADLSPATVIEFGIVQFLDLNFQTLSREHDATADSSILSDLPASIRAAVEQYALENEMPAEFVVELAIAHFLDPDSVTFDDCQVGVRHDRVELLKLHHEARQATAA
jgi:hypothetical protein